MHYITIKLNVIMVEAQRTPTAEGQSEQLYQQFSQQPANEEKSCPSLLMHMMHTCLTFFFPVCVAIGGIFASCHYFFSFFLCWFCLMCLWVSEWLVPFLSIYCRSERTIISIWHMKTLRGRGARGGSGSVDLEEIDARHLFIAIDTPHFVVCT